MFACHGDPSHDTVSTCNSYATLPSSHKHDPWRWRSYQLHHVSSGVIIQSSCLFVIFFFLMDAFIAINFLVELLLLHPINFISCISIGVWGYFKIFILIYFLAGWLFSRLLILTSWIFHTSYCYLFPVAYHCDWKGYLIWLNFFFFRERVSVCNSGCSAHYIA